MTTAQSADSLKYIRPIIAMERAIRRKYKYHKTGNHKTLSLLALLAVTK